jgi:hypothetical protein
MRILLSYASEFDKTEGGHFARVLRRLGHTVHDINVAATARGTGSPGQVVRGYPADVHIDEVLADVGGADLLIYLEPLGLIPRGLESVDFPTAALFADTHRNPEGRRKIARLFDHVFSYLRNYTGAFHEHPAGAVHWLPYAVDPESFRDRGVARDIDVAFIGRLHTQERRDTLARLRSRFKMNEDRYYLQSEIPEVYSRARMVVEIPTADMTTFRFFEALACGAMVVAKRVNGGEEELFTDGVHYVGYSDQRELEHEDERAAIARAGHALSLERHTLDIRLAELLRKTSSPPNRGAPARRMSARDVTTTYARIYERAGRVETLLKLAAEHRADRITRFSILGLAARSFLRRAILKW